MLDPACDDEEAEVVVSETEAAKFAVTCGVVPGIAGRAPGIGLQFLQASQGTTQAWWQLLGQRFRGSQEHRRVCPRQELRALTTDVPAA